MSHSSWRLRATTVGLGALAVATVLAGCADSRSASQPVSSSATNTGSAPAQAQATVTATHVFAAYDSGGAPAAGVTAHRSGTCFTSSITVTAPGAYRCFAGNKILDPCFAASTSSSARTVLCFADPWSRAISLSLTAKLPAPAAPLKITRPWAIELSNGRRCVAVTGTAAVADGVSFDYRCDTGFAGLHATTGSVLRATYRAPGGAVQQVGVVATWKA